MKTISQQEFEKLYGKQGSALFNQPQQDSGSGIGQALIDPIKSGINEVKNDTSQAFQGGLQQGREGVAQIGRGQSPMDLITGVGKVGMGFIQSVTSPLAAVFKPVGQGIQKYVDAVSGPVNEGITDPVQNFAQSKVGKGLATTAENVQNYAGIAGAVGGLMDAPNILNKGASALETATEVPKEIGGAIADTAENVKTGVSNVAKKAGNFAKGVLEGKETKALSIFTGEKNAVIESAMKNPEIADRGIQGGDVALRQAVQQGGQASLKAMKDFTSAYNESFNKLTAFSKGKLVGGKKVLYQFADDLKKSNVQITPEGKLDFNTSLIKANPGEISKIQAAYDAVKGWNDWSLSGIDQLKQMTGKLTKFATEAGGTSKSPFLGKFYHYLDTTIKENLPKNISTAYTKLNKKFSSNIGLYEDMVDAFNSGDPFKKIAQVFGENNDSLRQIIDFYEKTTGNKITPVAAGRILAERKQAPFGFLNPRSWIDFFIDPNTQAQIVTKVGKMKQP